MASPGRYVIIQGDALNNAGASITIVALMTSRLRDAPLLRLTIEPEASNGLERTSQVQTNRIVTIRTEKIGATIGRLNDQQQVELNRLLALAIGLA